MIELLIVKAAINLFETVSVEAFASNTFPFLGLRKIY